MQIAEETLNLDSFKLIILDLSENVKRQTILDINETKGDVQTLFQNYFAPKITKGDLKVAIF